MNDSEIVKPLQHVCSYCVRKSDTVILLLWGFFLSYKFVLLLKFNSNLFTDLQKIAAIPDIINVLYLVEFKRFPFN